MQDERRQALHSTVGCPAPSRLESVFIDANMFSVAENFNIVISTLMRFASYANCRVRVADPSGDNFTFAVL